MQACLAASRVQNFSQRGLTISELIVAKILAVQVQQIECEETGFAAAEKKILESRPSL
jgi:hypothetical protein